MSVHRYINMYMCVYYVYMSISMYAHNNMNKNEVMNLKESKGICGSRGRKERNGRNVIIL